jgi:hypothetical protein
VRDHASSLSRKRSGRANGSAKKAMPLELEEHVEVEHESAHVIPEKSSVLRISDIRVHFEGIKVVGQVRNSARETNGVSAVHLNILRNAHVQRKISRETILRSVDFSDVLLECVGGLVRETVAKLYVRHDSDLVRQGVGAPQEKTIGDFASQTSDEVAAHDRKRRISKIRTGGINVTAGVLPNVRKEKLAIGGRADPGRELYLSRLG